MAISENTKITLSLVLGIVVASIGWGSYSAHTDTNSKDIADLRGDVKTVQQQVGLAQQGIARIEGFLRIPQSGQSAAILVPEGNIVSSR